MHHHIFVIFVAIITLPRCHSFFGFGKVQSVAADGKLWCNGHPAANVKVKLFDAGILFDTKLAESRSDPKGRFYLGGWKREVSSIDPKLNIYHKCNRVAKCYRKFSIRIPASYIAKGKKPTKVFHLGVTDLSKKQPGETIDCVN